MATANELSCLPGVLDMVGIRPPLTEVKTHKKKSGKERVLESTDLKRQMMEAFSAPAGAENGRF